MKKQQLLRAALLGTLLGFGSMLQAAVINLSPTADGDVQTFGGDNVDVSDTKIEFTQSGGLIRNGILEFDLSAINASSITSARLDITLTRFVSNTGSTPAQIDIFAYNGDGVVNISDYFAMGTQVVDGSTAQGGVAGDVRSFVFTDLTSIEDALAGNLLTLRIETDSFASINFASLENGSLDAANLYVEYSAVPVPAAMWLMLSGMGVLAAFRRRG